jgi:hypothetical protein
VRALSSPRRYEFASRFARARHHPVPRGTIGSRRPASATGRPAKSRELMENHVRTVSTFFAKQIGSPASDLIEWR